MPDDPNNSTPDNTQAAPAPQPGNGTPSTTPDVQALIDAARAEAAKQATDAAWKQARLKYEKPASGGQQPPTKQEPPPGGNGQDALAILAIRDAFDDAISDMTLTGAQKRFARELVMKERPGDVAAYVTNLVELGGWNVKPTPNPGNGAAPAGAGAPPAANIAPPPAMPSGSPPARTNTDDTPFFQMSRPEQEALIKRIGPFEFKKLALRQLAETGQRFSLRR